MAFEQISLVQQENLAEILKKVFIPGVEVTYARGRKAGGYGVSGNSFKGVIAKVEGMNAYVSWKHQGVSGDECVNLFKLNDLNPEFVLRLNKTKPLN